MHLYSVADVMDNFNNLVYALSWDIDPYRSIQVNVPAFPPVMVEMGDLPRAVEDIRQLLLSALYNMPQRMTADEVRTYMRNDTTAAMEADDEEMDEDETEAETDDEDEDEDDEDEDEADDEDEDEEDEDDEDEAETDADEHEDGCNCEEYADMPPLVPASEANNPAANPAAPSIQSHSYFTRLQERLQALQNTMSAPAPTPAPVHTYFS